MIHNLLFLLDEEIILGGENMTLNKNQIGIPIIMFTQKELCSTFFVCLSRDKKQLKVNSCSEMVGVTYNGQKQFTSSESSIVFEPGKIEFENCVLYCTDLGNMLQIAQGHPEESRNKRRTRKCFNPVCARKSQTTLWRNLTDEDLSVEGDEERTNPLLCDACYDDRGSILQSLNAKLSFICSECSLVGAATWSVTPLGAGGNGKCYTCFFNCNGVSESKCNLSSEEGFSSNREKEGVRESERGVEAERESGKLLALEETKDKLHRKIIRKKQKTNPSISEDNEFSSYAFTPNSSRIVGVHKDLPSTNPSPFALNDTGNSGRSRRVINEW